MIISILGILKSGAAYVPIDIEYPDERIQYIERDSNCKVVVDEELIKDFKENDTSFVHRTDVNGRELSYEIVYLDKSKDFNKMVLTKKGLELQSTLDVIGILPFYNLGDDSYLVREYSDEYKLVYNEKSLGLFIKDWGSLTQIGNVSVNKIHEFLND